MNINRHNYEEYFILYMDNELGSEDRRLVEAFVLHHPDLKEELDQLLHYKLLPDTEIFFPGKEELIKINGETPITLSNCEEWLVLYSDNELNEEQRKEVEKFVVNNPSAQGELALLQRTKLQPEQIFFADKESLYRRSEKVKAFPARWWRAIAAVLILALGLTAVIIINNKQSIVKKDIANKHSGPENKINTDNSTQQIKKETPITVPDMSDNTADQTAAHNTVKEPGSPSVKKENKNITVKYNNTIAKDKIPALVPSAVKKEEPVVADNNKPSNNLPQPLNNPNINTNNAANNDAVTSINPSKETINPQESLTAAPVTNVIPASYTNNNDAGRLEEGGNNKKNRGFLRKLARTFEKRTNISATDDDRLLVGGLAFKLK